MVGRAVLAGWLVPSTLSAICPIKGMCVWSGEAGLPLPVFLSSPGPDGIPGLPLPG